MNVNINVIKTVIFVLIFSCAITAKAQQASGGSINGTLVDVANNQPLGFATVALIRKSDNKTVKGLQTDINGKFNLTGIDDGVYILRAVYIGYLTYNRDTLKINARRRTLHLGIIKMTASKGVLKEVQVTAPRSQEQIAIGKKSFNVDQSLVSQGGSATDLLANVPSVQVDANGNISLRGSQNVRVLINGKPSALTGNDLTDILQSIPASSIETIEVITNPSSKYDAEGDSGIINIILKKNTALGFTGAASASMGNHDTYNGTLSLAYQNSKINVYANYSYRQSTRLGDGFSTKNTTAVDPSNPIQSQAQDQISNQVFTYIGSNIRSGIDYNIDNKTTLSFSDNINIRDRYRLLTGNTSMSTNGVPGEGIYQDNFSPGYGINTDYNLDFDHKYKKEGEEFSANVGYSASQDNDFDYFSTDYDFAPSLNTADYDFNQYDHTLGHQRNWNIQADFVLPVKNGKWEMGYRSSINANDNNFVVDTSAGGNNAVLYDGALSNDFLYHEQVHSIYTNYSHTFGQFTIQGGLRLEDALISSEFIDTGRTQKFKDDYLRLYPSLFLTQKLSDNATLQFSYSRRVTRPRGQQIQPFLNTSNPLNYTEGNPELSPQDTHSFELSYLNYWKSLTLTSSLYYRLTYDYIQQITTVLPSNPAISVTDYENIGSASNAGYELIAKVSPMQLFDLTGNLNIYYKYIGGDPAFNVTSTSGWAWNGNLTANVRPTKKLSIQLRGDYTGPQVVPQGKMYAIYGVDGAIRYDITKKLNFSVTARDIFDTRRFDEMIDYTDAQYNIDEYTQRRFSTTMVLGTLAFRFGSSGSQKTKHRDQDQQQQQDQDNGGNPDDSGTGTGTGNQQNLKSPQQ